MSRDWLVVPADPLRLITAPEYPVRRFIASVLTWSVVAYVAMRLAVARLDWAAAATPSWGGGVAGCLIFGCFMAAVMRRRRSRREWLIWSVAVVGFKAMLALLVFAGATIALG